MKESLLQYLKCPATGQPLQLEATQTSDNGEVIEGQLVAGENSYSIVEGIPRFVDAEHYAQNFGYEWNRFNLTQLDSHTGSKHTFNTFEHKTGWTVDNIDSNDVILDVGCGAGRFLEVLASTGATVIGVDLSTAVNAAYEAVGHYPNIHVVQADVFKLPFSEKTFDRAYSIGVLHHTPSTKDAFMNIPPLVKDGGELAIWVYRKIPWAPKTLTHFSRLFTSKMSYEEVIQFSERLDKYWYPIVKLFKVGNIYPLRFLLLTSVYPNKEWRILNNFDAYSPPYNHQHTPKEVMRWFEEAGLKEIKSLKTHTTVTGRK